MLDLVLSIASLLYFQLTVKKPDSCFYFALVYNILHILTHLVIIGPILLKLSKLKTVKKIKRQFVRSITLSRYSMPVFCFTMITVSILCLYSIIAQIFNWLNYGYLFVIFCLYGSSLTRVCDWFKIKFDCSIFFSTQVYKFFCLVISSIMFGITSQQNKIPIQVVGMAWAYFIFRSKKSLPKQSIYYLILFMDVVILVTAIIVIASYQNSLLKQINSENVLRSKLTLFFTVTFFGSLLCMEIYDFVELYQNFGRRSQQEPKSQQNLIQFYLNLQNLKKQSHNQKRDEQDGPQETCSICLQGISHHQNSKQQKQYVTLHCGHLFHSQCLQQWAFINSTCPMCRKNMMPELQSENVI